MSLINGKNRKRLAFVCLFFVLCLAGTVRSYAAENVVASAKKIAGGSWKSDENGKRYFLKNSGKCVTNAWRKIGGKIYHFDEDGYAETGWITYKSRKYYADADGKLLVNRWLKKGKKYYYFLANGTLARKRMIKTNKKYYYVNQSGVRVKNTWVTQNGKKYYFNWDGIRMQNSWVKSGSELYYLGSSGAMAAEQWVDGGKHYVGSDGARLKNCVVDGYYLDAQGRKTIKPFYGDYIFVGDSRTVGMGMAIAPKDTLYIAKVSMGYSWLESTAGVELKQYLAANPNVTVVLAFGVNDLGNVDRYISYYENLIDSFSKTRFYVMAVNPVNEAVEAAHGYSVRNTEIAAFNTKMRTAIGKKKFINTYSYLKKKGFETSDGLHYSLNDYRNIYNFVMKKIKK